MPNRKGLIANEAKGQSLHWNSTHGLMATVEKNQKINRDSVRAQEYGSVNVSAGTAGRSSLTQRPQPVTSDQNFNIFPKAGAPGTASGSGGAGAVNANNAEAGGKKRDSLNW